MGLEAASLADSFLGGVVSSLQEPSEDPGAPFQLRENPDPNSVKVLLWAVSKSVRSMTSALSHAYVNSVLARRDSVLARAKVPLSRADKDALRVLPIQKDSLFGPQVAPTLKRGADQKRDLSSLRVSAPRFGTQSQYKRHMTRGSSSDRKKPRLSRGDTSSASRQSAKGSFRGQHPFPKPRGR